VNYSGATKCQKCEFLQGGFLGRYVTFGQASVNLNTIRFLKL